MLTKPDLPASERVDVKKTIKALEVHDWALVLKAFDDWPFAPEVSLSLIDLISLHGWLLICWVGCRNLWLAMGSLRTIGG
jgi:transcription factor 1